MDTPIRYISKIMVQGLWDRYDLEWNLNPDVNILSGVNGSGKSTVLDCAYGLLTHIRTKDKEYFEPFAKKISSINIEFNNGQYLRLDSDNDTRQSFEEKAQHDRKAQRILEQIQKTEGAKFQDVTLVQLISVVGSDHIELSNSVIVEAISSFDTQLLPIDNIQELKNKGITTDLDLQIYFLQKEYLNFQVNLGKEVETILLRNGTNSSTDALEARKPFRLFLEIADNLFDETGKKINRESNEIAFISGGKPLTPYQLSSGEKHLLIMLMTVLLQNQKSAILFLDEPEISLHFDWQERLIDILREMNPNLQLIIATHSPAMIVEGWLDKVVNIKDLVTLDRYSTPVEPTLA